MGIIQKLEAQAKKRERDWAMLRMAGYKLEPIYKKWYKDEIHTSLSDYIRYDGSLKRWCYSGNHCHMRTCKALSTEYKKDESS